jgi:hypothetical protein
MKVIEARLNGKQFYISEESKKVFYLKEWDGYISPDGIFYALKPTGINYWDSSFNIHEDWADQYIEMHCDGVSTLCPKDYMVDSLGWIAVLLNY